MSTPFTLRVTTDGCSNDLEDSALEHILDSLRAADVSGDWPEAALDEIAEDWLRDGDWPDEGCSVTGYWRLLGATYTGTEVLVDGSVAVDVEPDEDALMRAAGADKHCRHEFVSTHEVEGGLKENPGVWSKGGTTMVFTSHCKHCGLRRKIVDRGSQRDPGEVRRTVTFELPKEEE